MSDVEQHSKLCENCKLLGDKVRMIKSGLKRPAGINIGLFYLFCSVLPDSKIVPWSGFVHCKSYSPVLGLCGSESCFCIFASVLCFLSLYTVPQ